MEVEVIVILNTVQDMESLTISFLVDQTPKETFDAINNVRGWWTENLRGSSQSLNDEFEVRFGEVHYSKQRIIELIPGQKVVWLVTDSYLNFIEDKSEWTGTRISFEITVHNGKTQVRFTHFGLVPEYECYDACSSAWAGYVQGSLLRLISEGKGEPALPHP